MEILKKEIGPSDCTLAIALPLTQDEFLADLKPEASKDYAKFFRSQLWQKPGLDELWITYRNSISSLIDGVATEVSALGVNVQCGVKLVDLAQLLDGRRDIVTLVSHWRAAWIEPEDFIDFPAFVHRLRTSSDCVIVRLRERLSEGVAAQIEQLDSTAGRFETIQKVLVRELNDLLENENLGLRPGFDISNSAQRLHVEQRAYLNRKSLDAAFDGELKSGNRMEFFDGLQSAEAIRDEIPGAFKGLLDLIVCNSALPAEVIKMMKRDCLIISNQFPAKPSFRLLLYKAVIRALHNKPGPFVNTMMEVRRGLDEHLKNS